MNGIDKIIGRISGDAQAEIDAILAQANAEAVDIAARHGASIQYDEVSQAPHFNYFSTAWQEHEVWFEDARSVQAKLALIPEYGLQGVGYWNLMRPFPQNWQVLNALYDIRRA